MHSTQTYIMETNFIQHTINHLIALIMIKYA